MIFSKIIIKIKRKINYSIQYLNYIFCSILFSLSKKNNNKEYVLIFRTDAIGDFILSLDAIYTLSLSFSQKKKVLLVNSALYNWVKDFNFIDVVIPFNREKFILDFNYHCSLLKNIREYNYSEAFYFNYSREFLGDEIIKFSSADKKYGWKGNYSRISKFLTKISDKFYTDLVTSNKEFSHELDRNNEFVLKILKISDKIYHFSLLKNISDVKNTFIPKKKYFVVAPGSRIEKKIWNLRNFSEVIQWVYEKFGYAVVFVGSISEKELGEKIIKKLKNVLTYMYFGELNFNELIFLLSKAEFLLTNDNAISHFGTNLDLKMVAILGGGQFGRFAPYGSENQKWVYYKMNCFNCDWICKYSEFKCIQNISVENVKRNIEILLTKKQ